jgi:hypothetical protein
LALLFSNILFGSTTLLTWMTDNSLHMQWPLTSQSHGSVSQREQLVFHYGSNSTPRHIHVDLCKMALVSSWQSAPLSISEELRNHFKNRQLGNTGTNARSLSAF